MDHRKIFEIPNDQAVIVKLVEAIPLSWATIDGTIGAPASLIASGQVAINTGYLISYFEQKIIKGNGPPFWNPEYLERPDSISLIIDHKSPCFIKFEDAGRYPNYLPFETALRIATTYIRKGYRGKIILDGPVEDENGSRKDWRYLERCLVELTPHKKGKLFVEMNWCNKPAGKPELIEPILAVCKSLGLKELKPVK